MYAQMNTMKTKVVSAIVLIGIFVVFSSCNFMFSAESYRYICQTQNDCPEGEKCQSDKDGNKYCVPKTEPLDATSDDFATQPDTSADFFLEDLANGDASSPQNCTDNLKKICDNAPALPITVQKSIKGDWVAQKGMTEVFINVNCLSDYLIDATNGSTMDGHLSIYSPQENTSSFLSTLTLYLCIDIPETRTGQGFHKDGIPKDLFYGKGKIKVTENHITVIFDTGEGGIERTYEGTYAIEENGDALSIQLKGIVLEPNNPLALTTVTFKLTKQK